ncbi:MAG: GyrI-like domain-containing protein [Actinoallomurus sp.]
MTTGLIELFEHEPQRVAVVHGHVENSEYDGFLSGAFDEVRALLAHQHLSAAGPPFARYRATGVGLEVDAGLPVDGQIRPGGRVTTATLPGGAMVIAPHVGDHDTVGFTYEALSEWLAGNDYMPADDPWESYPDGGSRATLVTVPCRRRPTVPPAQHFRS